MKKSIALVFALLLAGALFAGKNNVVIQFSTVGPDKYADGTTVMDGECYALVWTPDDATFGGINSKGEAIGGNDKGQKCAVAIKAPIAKGGKCPNVQFQIDEVFANAHYPNGMWGVYLLDTRKFVTEEVTVIVDGNEVKQTQVKVDADGKKLATGVGSTTVSGYGQVVANVGRTLSPSGAKAGIVQSIPAGIQPPTIRDFKVVNGMVYIYLQNTAPSVSYGVAAGQAPGSLAPVPQPPVLGGGSETIIITPATGATGFFTPVVQ